MNCILLYQSIDTSMRRKRGLLPPIVNKPAPSKQQKQQQQQQQPATPSADGDGASPPLIPQPAV